MKNLQELIEITNSIGAQVPKPLIYRLYHDSLGRPLFYSMEQVPDLLYVDISAEQFNSAKSQVRVINGRLEELQNLKPKLKPNRSSGQSTHPHNVALIQPIDQPHVLWELCNHD